MSAILTDSAVLEPLSLDERHWAEAEQFIRRVANRHGCVNQHDADASCTSPEHARDAEMALCLLYATGCRDDPLAQWVANHTRAGKRRRVQAAGEPG